MKKIVSSKMTLNVAKFILDILTGRKSEVDILYNKKRKIQMKPDNQKIFNI